MLLQIDADSLSDDERYYLRKGLQMLKNPSPSCKKFIDELNRLSRESYDEVCRRNPGMWC